METKKGAERISIISFFTIVLLGTLLHFAFEASGGSTVVGAFTPVNESVWEHLKLILFPSILLGIPEYIIYGKNYEHFFASKAIATLIGMAVTVLGFYTYTGITGQNYSVANIVLFILSAAVTVYLTYRLTLKNDLKLSERDSVIGITLLTVVVIFFIYFTFNPPQIELFRDPISEDFGISDALRYIGF